MDRLIAFIWGMMEFRSCVTEGFYDLALMDAYDEGRDFAHRLTLRWFDN